MKKEIAERWIEALRSGGYKKVHGMLRGWRADGFCGFCGLGVLCDISGLGEWDGDGSAVFLVNKEMHNGGYLPLPVQQWSGMRKVGEKLIAALSDREGFTFAQLADEIEENWEYL